MLLGISLRSSLILFGFLRLGRPKGLNPIDLLNIIFKALLTLYSGYMPCPSQTSTFANPEYVRRTMLSMKFVTVKPPTDPFLTLVVSKYSPQVLVYKYFKSMFVCERKKSCFTGRTPLFPSLLYMVPIPFSAFGVFFSYEVELQIFVLFSFH